MKPDLSHQYTCSNIDWAAISHLFELVGWGKRDPADVQNAFLKSSNVCFVKNLNEIIAIGRTVDDGKYYGLIVDVVVHPEHQGKGIGAEVVNYLKSKMSGYKFVTLTSAPGMEGFYEKLGWKKQKTAYLWPIDSKQEEQHAL